MELHWYETSWRSGSLWLDHMQQTLIEDHFFPWRGKEKKKPKPTNLLFLRHQSINLKGWGRETYNTSLTLCPSYCTQPAFAMRSVLLEPGTHSMGSSRCQARALLLRPRHYLSGSWASSYMRPFYTENFTQTFPLSSSFALFFSFIFSW